MSRARRSPFRFATDRLVSPEQTRSPLAPHARSIRDLGFGNHASADAGEDGHSLLGTLDARVADDCGARARKTRARSQIVGRFGILLARAEFAEGGAENCRTAQREFPTRARAGFGTSGDR